jgi:hypothetical protein
VRLREHLSEEELEEAGVVAEPVVAVVLGPAFVRLQLVVPAVASGTAGQMNTAPSTRSGCAPARSSARCAPSESETRTALSVAVASSTASASAANSRSSYAAASCGRSERPLPRPSNTSTRQCRARYGICIFQWREWMIDHVGRRRTVVSPLP